MKQVIQPSGHTVSDHSKLSQSRLTRQDAGFPACCSLPVNPSLDPAAVPDGGTALDDTEAAGVCAAVDEPIGSAVGCLFFFFFCPAFAIQMFLAWMAEVKLMDLSSVVTTRFSASSLQLIVVLWIDPDSGFKLNLKYQFYQQKYAVLPRWTTRLAKVLFRYHFDIGEFNVPPYLIGKTFEDRISGDFIFHIMNAS